MLTRYNFDNDKKILRANTYRYKTALSRNIKTDDWFWLNVYSLQLHRDFILLQINYDLCYFMNQAAGYHVIIIINIRGPWCNVMLELLELWL